MRLFVADADGEELSELTPGGGPVVRLVATDLPRAQRDTARIRANRAGVAVILDVAVDVPGDFRSPSAETTVHYAGTVDGLAGLIDDIDRADVADGVTLLPALGPVQQDLRALALDVLRRLAEREQEGA